MAYLWPADFPVLPLVTPHSALHVYCCSDAPWLTAQVVWLLPPDHSPPQPWYNVITIRPKAWAIASSCTGCTCYFLIARIEKKEGPKNEKYCWLTESSTFYCCQTNTVSEVIWGKSRVSIYNRNKSRDDVCLLAGSSMCSLCHHKIPHLSLYTRKCFERIRRQMAVRIRRGSSDHLAGR
jgi:hypothetical protein